MTARIRYNGDEYTFDREHGWQGPDRETIRAIAGEMFIAVATGMIHGDLEPSAVRAAQAALGHLTVEVIDWGERSNLRPEGLIR